jgi:hypothetical protein
MSRLPMKRIAVLVITTSVLAVPAAGAKSLPPYSALRQTVQNNVQTFLEKRWTKNVKDYPALIKNTTARCTGTSNTHMDCYIVQNGHAVLANISVQINPQTSYFVVGKPKLTAAFNKLANEGSSAAPSYTSLDWVQVSCAQLDRNPSWWAIDAKAIGSYLGQVDPTHTISAYAKVALPLLKKTCAAAKDKAFAPYDRVWPLVAEGFGDS